ncbi:MAG: hypothetical protein Q4C63_04770 [Eubacteriales bacterium]|nr:hypothetical protein [Eubacteriales bacterium]
MAVLLFILKMLGALVLFLLALLLLLLLLLLFVPFRYRLSGSYEKEVPDGTVSVSWLFHAVRLQVTYHHGAAVSGDMRIFGVPVRRFEAAAKERETERGHAADQEETLR